MNYQEVMELTRWLETSAFTSYTISINGVSLSVSKQGAPLGTAMPAAPIAQPPAPPPPPLPLAPPTPGETPQGHIITSPIVGTFYEGPNDQSPPYVKVGQPIKKGDTLCILEAMKVMNEITADRDGTIAEVFVSNGDMVEARMPLFRVV